MDYAVRFGDKTVGKAQVTVEGLYYHVVCRCKLTGEVMVRLEAACGDKRENLGILIPGENGFELDTRFPISRLLPRHDPLAGRVFVPITPEEPFAYLERLKTAFLEIQEGKKGASLLQKEDPG